MADLSDYLGATDPAQAAQMAKAYAAALRRQGDASILAQLSGDPVLMRLGAGLGERAAAGEESLNKASEFRLNKAMQKAKEDREIAILQNTQRHQNLMEALAQRSASRMESSNAERERLAREEFEWRKAHADDLLKLKADAANNVKVPAAQALGITTAAEVAENVPKVKKALTAFQNEKDPIKKAALGKQLDDANGLLALAIARGETKTGNPRADIVNKVKERLPGTKTGFIDQLFGTGIADNVYNTLTEEAEVRARTGIEGLGLPDEHPLSKQYQRAFGGGSTPGQAMPTATPPRTLEDILGAYGGG